MKKAILSVSLIIISILFLCVNNDYALNGSSPDVAEELRLYLGESKVIPVRNPTRIAIGNPSVADVAGVTAAEINLVPKSVGTTTFTFWDNFGEQSYQLKVFAEDMQKIKERADNLLDKINLPDVYTQAADEEGKVILLGEVKTPQDRERIATVLGTLGGKLLDLVVLRESEKTVEIDVQILELNKDATETLGITWPGSTGTITLTDASQTLTVAKNLLKNFNINRFTHGAMSLSWKLDLLIQEGKARILSRPRLACQSGKEAELMVGGEKPIFTTEVAATTGAQGTSVEYKEFGIKLKIKPTVTDNERIKLALNVEVSDVGTAEFIGATTARSAQAYPLSKRTASTELFLNDGESMSIGGLIKQKTEEDLRKFPWLADVPVLGVFFRQRVTRIGGGQGERGNTELFIILTPKIIGEKKETAAEKTSAAAARVSSEASKIIITPMEEEPKQETAPAKASIAVATKAELSGPVDAYAKIIQKRILENLIYPASAKQAGFEGTTKISIRLTYTGKLLDVKVKDSSGYRILDDSSVYAAKSISSYPPFPPQIVQAELWIDVPVTYQLN